MRYVFEALSKVNRTDIALQMLSQTEYPSFGYQITNTLEPATSLWESYDAPTMHQWLDESSRVRRERERERERERQRQTERDRERDLKLEDIAGAASI